MTRAVIAEMMSTVVKPLSEADIANLAAFYHSLRP
jgi:cytochrome c553